MGENRLTIYCDGGARGNPGPAAAAFVAINKGRVVDRQSNYLGVATNNVAEYSAVIMALSWVLNNSEILQDGKVIIFVDSELIARQLAGQYRAKSQNLKPLITRAKKLEEKISRKIVYHSVPRSKNRLADFLVNKELDKSR